MSKRTLTIVFLGFVALLSFLSITGLTDVNHINGITANNSGNEYPNLILLVDTDENYLGNMNPSDADNRTHWFIGDVPPLNVRVSYWRFDFFGRSIEAVFWDKDASKVQTDFCYQKDTRESRFFCWVERDFNEAKKVLEREDFLEGFNVFPDNGVRYLQSQEYLTCKAEIERINPRLITGTRVTRVEKIDGGLAVTLRSYVYGLQLKDPATGEDLQAFVFAEGSECTIRQGSMSCSPSDSYDRLRLSGEVLAQLQDICPEFRIEYTLSKK